MPRQAPLPAHAPVVSYVGVGERGSGGVFWHALPDQYERILHAFEQGRGLCTFTSPDGVEVTVRVIDITAITFVSDAALATIQAREARERLET